jgi:RNA polymerase sigma-70 factor (ECF subfamily)
VRAESKVAGADEILIERAKSGDRRAFDELVRRHRDFVARAIRRRVTDDALCDDVVQKTFLRAFEAIATFRGESAFSTWLYRIAMNGLHSELRDDRSRDHVSVDQITLITNALRTSKLVAREVQARLQDAIAQLSPKQRRVVELRLLDELPFREIGVLAECSEESARQNFSMALRRLRAMLLP